MEHPLRPPVSKKSSRDGKRQTPKAPRSYARMKRAIELSTMLFFILCGIAFACLRDGESILRGAKLHDISPLIISALGIVGVLVVELAFQGRALLHKVDRILRNQGVQQEVQEAQNGRFDDFGKKQIEGNTNLRRVMEMVADGNRSSRDSVELLEVLLTRLESVHDDSAHSRADRDRLIADIKHELSNLGSHMEAKYREIQDANRLEVKDLHEQLSAKLHDIRDTVCDRIELRDQSLRRAQDIAARQARMYRRHGRFGADNVGHGGTDSASSGATAKGYDPVNARPDLKIVAGGGCDD